MKNFVRVILGVVLGIVLTAGVSLIFVGSAYHAGHEDGYDDCTKDVRTIIRYEMYKRGIIVPEEPKSYKDTIEWNL
jgi:hypothetical protein